MILNGDADILYVSFLLRLAVVLDNYDRVGDVNASSAIACCVVVFAS